MTREPRAVVGSAGFQGMPTDHAIELGFAVHPDHRNRGFASEAARALVSWGLRQPDVARIIAQCDPGNAASVRVLEKAGLRRAGMTQGMLLWETRQPST
jgi:RimJ/RimL family protein N-acetyltransferase